MTVYRVYFKGEEVAKIAEVMTIEFLGNGGFCFYDKEDNVLGVFNEGYSFFKDLR